MGKAPDGLPVRYARGSRKRLLSEDAPEVAGQAGAGKQPLHRFGRARAPSVLQPIGIPGSGQSPDLINRHDRALRDLSFRAPSADMLFRPEEQQRRSRVRDVVPELLWRHRVMHHAFDVDATAAHGQRD
jgi:hypothetical protein